MATLNRNPYIRTNWRDHIVDVENGQTIQEGTRFTAGRANNLEEGIYNAYNWLVIYANDLERMRVELEMVGRSPINNGIFYDALDGDGKALKMVIDTAVAQNAYSAGTTNIELDNVPFNVGEYVTIFDDEQQESIEVTSVGEDTITVSSLANSYKKGAFVSRSNSFIDTNIEELGYGNWSTYTLEINEVV
ncbi:hypothetical protein F9U64_18915 [Gracilibacillus oryzae]|uniref:Uncharacterized protein n=1 Tax=Gracilibacillus oryzae TaxID=1672701 RepID=A0A7C8GR14_9BACI|nr:hypothetical protein [Gracilibacillus oryzae]KAB8126893.1 hypothetical protein F9U64_18915 [Gracilibacillus oryzae]